jgi:hypothetical protein
MEETLVESLGVRADLRGARCKLRALSKQDSRLRNWTDLRFQVSCPKFDEGVWGIGLLRPNFA